MHTSADEINQVCQQLKVIAEDMAVCPPLRIDFRERVRLERALFVVTKEVCHHCLGYDLQGFSETHRLELSDWMEGNACSKSLRDFVRKAFELRVFILALSSASLYVHGDALSRAAIAEQNVLKTLSRSLHSLADNAIKEKSKYME